MSEQSDETTEDAGADDETATAPEESTESGDAGDGGSSEGESSAE